MIDNWGQWWVAHLSEDPVTGLTTWVPSDRLAGKMTPKFRSIYELSQKRLARSRSRDEKARRRIAVTRRKYRARRKRK